MNIFTKPMADFVTDAFDAPDFVRNEEPTIAILSCFGMYIEAAQGIDIVTLSTDQVNDLLQEHVDGFLSAAAVMQFGDHGDDE